MARRNGPSPGADPAAAAPSLSRLFTRWRAGDEDAAADLLPRIYGELRALADVYLRRERRGHTLQPTELVNEAFVRLLGAAVEPTDRTHFFALAARAMRRILVDHARRLQAGKRFAPEDRVTMDTVAGVTGGEAVDVLDLHRVLKRFATIAPRPAELVELRFFAGLTLEEAAQAAGVSRATAARDWEAARIWLSGELAS